MALVDLAKQASTDARKGPTCSVCMALAELEPSESAALRSLLSNPRWRYSELSERLRNDPDTPLDLNAHSLARHARGGCSAHEKLR